MNLSNEEIKPTGEPSESGKTVDVRDLKDFEKILLFLHCVQSGEPRNERTIRMLFDWDADRYNSAIQDCVERGFISQSDTYDVLDESVIGA